MPTTTWNTTIIDGDDYLVLDTTQFRVSPDWDPSSESFVATAPPVGGINTFLPLVRGDVGDPPDLSAVNYAVLEATDPTPNSASWTETAPGVFTLNLVLHKGPQGDQGDTVWNMSDFTGVEAGKMIAVNSTEDDFELVVQKVGDRYIPSAIASIPVGNTAATLCSVTVPPQPFDWRPEVSGECVITLSDFYFYAYDWWTAMWYGPGYWAGGTAVIHLIARLDNETTGNEVGRGFIKSTFGSWSPITLSSGPPAGSSSSYDKVQAGNSATIYLRAERQSGAGTFTTSAATTRFCVQVRPVP